METYAQHSIKHCLAMIAPYEMPNQQKEDGRLQFYQFMVSIYREMYDKPEEYMVFPKPYEEYMAKLIEQEVQKKKEKAQSMCIGGKIYVASTRIMNTLCCVFISTILRIFMSFGKFYLRKTTIYFNGSKISFPKDYANVPVIEGFILAMSPGVFADCQIGQK